MLIRAHLIFASDRTLSAPSPPAATDDDEDDGGGEQMNALVFRVSTTPTWRLIRSDVIAIRVGA